MTKERFNPFKDVNGTYGAPMGRHSKGKWEGVQRLNCKHCGGDGYYDRGGAYWGHSKVYAVYTPSGDYVQYIEATSRKEALRAVYKEYETFPNIRFYENSNFVDKYTAVFIDEIEKKHYAGFGKPYTVEYAALSFNDSPFHPLGVGMHTTAMKGEHLGHRIAFEDLPHDAQCFVLDNV